MLEKMQCEACEKGARALELEEQQTLLAQLTGWQRIQRENIAQLEKCYSFKNFKLAWAFANQVAELAEQEFHHPTIVAEWGKVTVTWWSHSIKGLHRNDFICAAKCDALLQ